MIVECYDGNYNRRVITNCVGFYTDAERNLIVIEMEDGKHISFEFENKPKMNMAYNDMLKSAEKWIKLQRPEIKEK